MVCRSSFNGPARRSSVKKIAPSKAPQAVGGLLDAGCEPARAVELLSALDAAALRKEEPTLTARLVGACEQRGQLPILRPWLKAREAEGLGEGHPAAAAVRSALKTLEPLKRMFA